MNHIITLLTSILKVHILTDIIYRCQKRKLIVLKNKLNK